eukprot:2614654-Amphidinium_carterae.1
MQRLFKREPFASNLLLVWIWAKWYYINLHMSWLCLDDFDVSIGLGVRFGIKTWYPTPIQKAPEERKLASGSDWSNSWFQSTLVLPFVKVAGEPPPIAHTYAAANALLGTRWVFWCGGYYGAAKQKRHHVRTHFTDR